ncbi:MAG: hypothetical protein COA45_06775 [Zetaproteobacteria bacterium]|nr:MAG: hypothetical protein COA45_06775 [Zetaproteobacteria bacterium]
MTPIKRHTKNSLLFLFLLIFISYLPKHAFAAACVTPTAVTFGACTTAGEWGYDSVNKAFRYCDGTNYASMESSTTAGSCAGVTEGTLEYDTGLNNFKFCNGTNWIEFADNGSAGSCSVSGRIEYNTGTDEVNMCNGTTKAIPTDTTGDAGSLSVTGDVSWVWDTDDSGTYTETHTITVTNNGACDQTITSVAVLPENDCAASPFTNCTGSVEGYKIFTEDCTGTLNAAANCTIDIKAQVIIPAGGSSSVPGTLRVITSSALTEDTSLSLSGCDGVGGDSIC